MRGSLGEKIGEGAFADVHAWTTGQVVKLSKPGVPRRINRWEARMTRAVFAVGVPVPEVFGEVTLEGRFGIVLGRLDGPTLLQHYRSGAVTFEQAGAILATLAMSVHKTPPPPDVISLHDYMDGSLRHSGGTLPRHIATGIFALIERLRPGDGLCHGDLHPDNVIMTAEGPKLIDWISTVSAPAAFELARIHVGLSEIAPELVDNPERPRAVNAATQSEYARLAGMSTAALARDRALPADSPRRRRPRGAFACLAGATDPAHRSGPALGGLSRARAGVVCPSDSSMSELGPEADLIKV